MEGGKEGWREGGREGGRGGRRDRESKEGRDLVSKVGGRDGARLRGS